jgi:peptide/nickel transport system substrate-binding protein
VDDVTVRIVTRMPFATLPTMLGYLANILPEHILGNYSVEQLRNPVEFLRHPVGTGPFRFGESVLGSHVRLVAYDRYITVLAYNWFGDGLRDAIDPGGS